MNKLASFLGLIRFKNLLIIVLIQAVIKVFLINSYLNHSALSNIDFGIYLLALVTIAAGGYIINDIYDLEIDKINKPATRIIENKISKEFSFKAYYILNIIGITSGFYVSYQVNKLWFGCIFIFFVFSLWKYSKEYKASFLIGNLQIAFLAALSIIALALFDLIPVGIKNENGSKIIFYIILFYAGFSFITTLIREIIKDLEDIEGDKKINANTLAINYGVTKTKKIIALLILIPIFGIAYLQYFQYNNLSNNLSVSGSAWQENFITALYTFFLQILLVILIIRMIKSRSKSDFHFSSTLCKIIMLVGILSIPLFYFLY
ncbi:MAG: geranylgeranylglycerol-phosphate geranylgeranyltransferase [Bacteroidota bacterium]|nr:geranylgeranylglycerol-phosphate geranylgeranyltransferase [Bacteroidota bacterium]